jgi:hypothetical protein
VLGEIRRLLYRARVLWPVVLIRPSGGIDRGRSVLTVAARALTEFLEVPENMNGRSAS